MSWPAWKQLEKRIAERLDGQRLGNRGISSPDVIDGSGWLVVECKHRGRLPAWLLDALISAETHAEDDQLPVAILHQKHMVIDDSLVVLRFDDFLRLWR